MLFQHFHRSGIMSFQASLGDAFPDGRVDLPPAPAHRGLLLLLWRLNLVVGVFTYRYSGAKSQKVRSKRNNDK